MFKIVYARFVLLFFRFDRRSSVPISLDASIYSFASTTSVCAVCLLPKGKMILSTCDLRAAPLHDKNSGVCSLLALLAVDRARRLRPLNRESSVQMESRSAVARIWASPEVTATLLVFLIFSTGRIAVQNQLKTTSSSSVVAVIEWIVVVKAMHEPDLNSAWRVYFSIAKSSWHFFWAEQNKLKTYFQMGELRELQVTVRECRFFFVWNHAQMLVVVDSYSWAKHNSHHHYVNVTLE